MGNKKGQYRKRGAGLSLCYPVLSSVWRFYPAHNPAVTRKIGGHLATQLIDMKEILAGKYGYRKRPLRNYLTELLTKIAKIILFLKLLNSLVKGG